jgi:putative transposase
MSRTKPWELSDALWERAEPLIPPREGKKKTGRPPHSDRAMLGAILFVLRTGIQWNALPREVGASTTVYDRFRLWLDAGFFAQLWAAGLQEYDELVGIDWQWQSLDGALTKAPFGGAATGANPTDRGKRGTKRSTLSEGHGLPLAIAVDGANIHDTKLVAVTLEAVVIPRPECAQHLCLDAGYVGDKTKDAVTARGYVPHVRPRGEDTASARLLDPTKTPRRWVVESTQPQYPPGALDVHLPACHDRAHRAAEAPARRDAAARSPGPRLTGKWCAMPVLASPSSGPVPLVPASAPPRPRPS